MRVLVTGFEPFGGSLTNSSWEVCCALRRQPVDGVCLILPRRPLPVRFGADIKALMRLVRSSSPDTILALGQHPNTSAIRLERYGHNIKGSPDTLTTRPIVSGGPAAYSATVPLQAMTRALRRTGIPVMLSSDSGSFLCNHLLYRYHHIGTAAPMGFVHLPRLPGEAARHHPPPPSMALSLQRAAITTLLSTLKLHAHSVKRFPLVRISTAQKRRTILLPPANVQQRKNKK